MSAQHQPADLTTPAESPTSPRVDFYGGCGWIAFGLAVLVGSLTMDRLERQHINPYTAPGLLPGLLGIGMIVLGTVLAWRSWRRGAWHVAAPAAIADRRDERPRIAVAIALCLGYGVVLIGHGLPFWLGSTVYVAGAILVFRRLSRDPLERRFTPGSVLQALVVAVATAFITQWVFQELFLVRLP